MMDLRITGDSTTRVLALVKREAALATTMARQLLAAIEPSEMATYLLTPDVVLELLAKRLADEPERTLRDLQALAEGQSTSRSAHQLGRRKHRRVRLSPKRFADLKEQVQELLRLAGPSSRKQIETALRFPSRSIYNRVMTELRDEKKVVAKGKRGKARYEAAR